MTACRSSLPHTVVPRTSIHKQIFQALQATKLRGFCNMVRAQQGAAKMVKLKSLKMLCITNEDDIRILLDNC